MCDAHPELLDFKECGNLVDREIKITYGSDYRNRSSLMQCGQEPVATNLPVIVLFLDCKNGIGLIQPPPNDPFF